jgi:Ca2+/H+ antiporter, TMEM165/GDT1 family
MTASTAVGPSVVASFLASLVEFVEALTIVLAVGIVRGWRSALLGAGAGIVVLAGLVLGAHPPQVNRPSARRRLPICWMRASPSRKVSALVCTE